MFESHPAPTDEQVTWYLGENTIHAGEVRFVDFNDLGYFSSAFYNWITIVFLEYRPLANMNYCQ